MKVPIGLKKTAAMMVLQFEDNYLLLKRKNEPNQGMYVPVGGKLDPYESPQAAAIRETWEETGIQVDAPKFAGILVETSPTKYNWQSYIYLAQIDYQPAPPCDEGTLEWINSSRLLDIPTPPTDWVIYQYLQRNQKFIFNALYNDQLKLVEMMEEIEGKPQPIPE